MQSTPQKNSSDSSRAPLRHLLVVAACLLAAITLTYLVPSLRDWRPWLPEEGMPIARLFAHHEEVPDVAGEAGSYRAQDSEHSASNDDAVALNETFEATEPDSDSAIEDPRAGEPDQEKSPVTSAAQHIEDPTGKGLRPFLQGLTEIAQQASGKQPTRVVRVAHYGDSSIATDLITHTVRRRLQRVFGDAGHGFIIGAAGYLHYRHRDVMYDSSDDWKLREVVRKQDAAGLYGYGGVQARGKAGAWSRWGSSKKGAFGQQISRFQIYYQAHPQGADISVWLDREPYADFSTRSDAVTDQFYTVDVPRGIHRLDLYVRNSGEARVYGAVLENDGPGVVYDSLGLVGARGSRLLNFDRTHIQQQLATRDIDLLILGFGGNESDDDLTEDQYYQEYTKVLDQMFDTQRTFGCMLLAPLDQAKKRGRHIETLSSLPRVINAQRRAAFEHGCAYFDTWSAMGGTGSMERWYNQRPRLALGDFHHATPEGYEIIGNLLADALIEAYEKSNRDR